MTDTSTTSDTQPVMEYLDPNTLLVDLNVRSDAALDKAFIDSIRDHGVLVPIVGIRTEDDAVVRVRYGHRRTLAAVEVGRPTVPVWVFPAGAEADDSVDRIVKQWAENEHRTGLTDADRLAAVEQLQAFGLSPAQMTKRLHTPRKQVDAALTASGSVLAKAAIARYDFLDLLQAAVVAEFEDDADTVKALVTAAKTGQFDHVAQRARDERAREQQLQAFADAARERGVTIIEPNSGLTRLSEMTDAEGTALTVENHATCPGHAASVSRQYGYSRIDRTTGLVIAESDDDESDDGGGGEDSEREWGQFPTLTFVCTDPEVHGHKPRWQTRPAAPAKRSEMTDEQAEAARAERRDVIASNKAWKSAEVVRREWLRIHLARKTPPKGSAVLIAQALANNPSTIAQMGGNHLAADLLGREASHYGINPAISVLIDKATEQRAQVIALAIVLAGYEANTDTNSWRRVDTGTRRYLTFLAECGYALSDVERRACGEQPLPDASEHAA